MTRRPTRQPGQQLVTIRPRRPPPDARRPTGPPTTSHIGSSQARDGPHDTQPTGAPAHANAAATFRRHHPRHHRRLGTGLDLRRPAAAASMITCALVPLIPNDDTPARRGRPSAGQGLRLGQQRHRPRRPIHMRTGRIHMQRRRQHLMAHRLHHLDHPGHPRRGLGMTHIRLDRPQPQRLGSRSCP